MNRRSVDECIAIAFHEELKACQVKWSELPHVGMQDDGDGGQFDLRNCSECRTTLAMVVQS